MGESTTSADPPTGTRPAAPARRLARFMDSDLFFSFRRSPVVLASAVVLAVFVLAALLAPLIAPQNPFDPASLNLMDGKTPPLAKINTRATVICWVQTTKVETCFR